MCASPRRTHAFATMEIVGTVECCVFKSARQHFREHVWCSARANKALMPAVVCVSLRGYLWCFVSARGSQIPLKSPPSLSPLAVSF